MSFGLKQSFGRLCKPKEESPKRKPIYENETHKVYKDDNGNVSVISKKCIAAFTMETA